MERFKEKPIEAKFQEPQQIESPKFDLSEFYRAKEEFESLVKQLSPAIRNHEYNLVIGDDACGRIPTLVIGGLMREIYKQDKIALPQILFLAGQRQGSDTEEKLDRYLQKVVKEKKINPEQTKVLLVTEYMERGTHMAYFVEALRKFGFTCETATLASQPLNVIYNWSPELKDIKIHIGEVNGPICFYGCWEEAGVEKEKQKDEREIFAKRRQVSRYLTLKAREDTKKMVDYLKQIYEKEKEATI